MARFMAILHGKLKHGLTFAALPTIAPACSAIDACLAARNGTLL